jgi:hypothetical protein
VSFPSITSVGPPPERHADRVVAEMLKQIAEWSAPLLPGIAAAIKASSDGSPKAQRKLEARIKQAGAFDTVLTPGKRGRYELAFFCWGGWNPTTRSRVLPGDPLPEKPWLAIHAYRILSDGRGSERIQIKSRPVVFVTHHALSRLAQRAGARAYHDLLEAMVCFWDAAAELLANGKLPQAPPEGWRVLVKTAAGDAIAVIYRDEEGSFIVKTVLPTQPEPNA